MLQIDPLASAPPFEQLRQQILEQAQSGELAAGAKLPTVRQLADELGIAPNTVARAYKELEALGIIETRGRNGSFVNAQGDAASRRGQLAARDYANVIRSLGVAPDDALAWVAAALHE